MSFEPIAALPLNRANVAEERGVGNPTTKPAMRSVFDFDSNVSGLPRRGAKDVPHFDSPKRRSVAHESCGRRENFRIVRIADENILKELVRLCFSFKTHL